MILKRKKSCLKLIFPVLLVFVHEISSCNLETNYLCRDGKTCIPKSYICNGFCDCPLKDDELYCETMKCSDTKNFFLCRDQKTCIARSLICDEEGDCPDYSDESDKLCEENTVSLPANSTCDNLNRFKCKSNGVCIPIVDMCNGAKNCADGSDEDKTLCENISKNCKGFMCENRKCLESHSFVCDGFDDCGDGSDEEHCSPNCEGRYVCKSGDECIDLDKLCNNITDCTDESDEGDFCNKNSGTDEIRM